MTLSLSLILTYISENSDSLTVTTCVVKRTQRTRRTTNEGTREEDESRRKVEGHD